ncbi:MAG TPA: glycosyltransferase family 39 protein [Anaerolineaceae bacterium]
MNPAHSKNRRWLESLRAALQPVFSVQVMAVAVIFLTAAILRFYDLSDPPLDFHPTRQLHSALISRGYLAAWGGGNLTDFERSRAVALGASESRIEPPVIEFLAACLALLGTDVIFAGRALAAGAWLFGGLPVFWTGRRFGGVTGGMVALLLFFFLPYAVIASRAFQPDPLMVSLIAWALWAILRFGDTPSPRRAAWAGLLAGAAILVKQVAVFPLGLAFAGCLLADWEWHRAAHSRTVWLIGILSFLPALLYNVYGVFGDGFLSQQYALRFFPALYSDPGFYIRWMLKVESTVSLPVLLGALLGLALLQNRNGRGLLIGGLAGYLLYGFAFAYHISTHDYYQEPLFPLVALGMAPLAGWIWKGIGERSGKPGRVLSAAALIGITLFTLYTTRSTLRRTDFRPEPPLWRALAAKMEYDSANVIGLFDDYGYRLMYWGYMMPANWSTTGDEQMRILAGQTLTPQDFQTITGSKRFFVVQNLKELENQPILRNTLYNNYTIFDQTNAYIVFDLKSPKNATQPGQ